MEAEELALEKERLAERRVKDARRLEREQRRRQQKLQRKFADDDEELGHKIAVEERKLLVAQRKLESIRLLDELLERIKVMMMMTPPATPRLQQGSLASRGSEDTGHVMEILLPYLIQMISTGLF